MLRLGTPGGQFDIVFSNFQERPDEFDEGFNTIPAFDNNLISVMFGNALNPVSLSFLGNGQWVQLDDDLRYAFSYDARWSGNQNTWDRIEILLITPFGSDIVDSRLINPRSGFVNVTNTIDFNDGAETLSIIQRFSVPEPGSTALVSLELVGLTLRRLRGGRRKLFELNPDELVNVRY